MPVVVTFECETEADAIAVVEKLEADRRGRAAEVRLADGRTLGFDEYREELRAKQNAVGKPNPDHADN